MFDYYFGIPDLWRRGRRILAGVGLAAAGAAVGALVATDAAFLGGLLAVAGGLWYAQPALKRLLVPSPFSPARWRYAPLLAGIDWDGTAERSATVQQSAADTRGGTAGSQPGRPDTDNETGVRRWLAVGSDTARPLVGVSDAVPDGCRVAVVDSFDGRGTPSPALVRRNAARAGLTAESIRASVSALPVATDSQDLVTVCQRPEASSPAQETIEETRRVVRPDGQVGVVGLTPPAEETADPLDHWERLLADAGFTVTASGRVDRRGDTARYVICTPADEAASNDNA